MQPSSVAEGRGRVVPAGSGRCKPPSTSRVDCSGHQGGGNDHLPVVAGVGVIETRTPAPSFQGGRLAPAGSPPPRVGAVEPVRLAPFTYRIACIRDMGQCRAFFTLLRENHQRDKRDTASPPAGKALACGFAGRARHRDKGATKENVSCHSATYTGGSLGTPCVSRWV